MATGITHSFNDGHSDGGDSTVVRPSNWNAGHAVDSVAASGLTGATAASRYAGGTASGAPGSGTFAVGDFVIDQTAAIWVCTVAGSPGTWVKAGGGGTTIQYPALKPGSPTDDFAASSIDGAWSAHSSVGSFTTGHCMTQGIDWAGSSIEMQFSGQMGMLYRSHGNGDIDIQVGGMRIHTLTHGQNMMYGIAALDSAGTGIAVLVYNDQQAYFASMTTWGYASNTDSWAYGGYQNGSTPNAGWFVPDKWMRLTRVSGTWTGYISESGRVWDKTFNTRADSVTVDKVGFGLLHNISASPAYYGRLTADYFDVAV